jgi:hypothetical protein
MKRKPVENLPSSSDCFRVAVVWEFVSRRIKRADDRESAKEIAQFLHISAARLAVAKEADDRDDAVARALQANSV